MKERLQRWLGGHLGRSFSWGELDCSTFVLSWLEACSGLRAIDDVRGMYSSEEEAVLFSLRHGRDLAGILRDAGAVEISEADLDAGDVALVATSGRPWWRGHVIIDRDSFASCWPGRGVGISHRIYLRGGERSFWRLPFSGEVPCHQ